MADMAQQKVVDAHTSTKDDNVDLPKLSREDFHTYNHMSEHMNQFHESFRHTWKTLYSACSSNKRPAGMSLRQLINMGLEFCQHLTVHHTIEERHIFPVLAKRMDGFKVQGGLLEQHKQIHEGLEKMEGVLGEWKTGERDVELREMKQIMDGFGEVLWTHLDEEVRTLGAENMRRYWTLDEMRRMPM